MTIVGAHCTAFQVADLQRSLAFHRDLLGFEVVWERVNREDYVRPDGFPVELVEAIP